MIDGIVLEKFILERSAANFPLPLSKSEGKDKGSMCCPYDLMSPCRRSVALYRDLHESSFPFDGLIPPVFAKIACGKRGEEESKREGKEDKKEQTLIEASPYFAHL